MREFTYQALPGRVVFGAGTARTQLAEELRRVPAHRVLLVVSAAKRSLATELTAPISELIAATYPGVRPHVPLEVAEEARALAAETGADAVLSIGGGSTTGTAKAVALTTGLPVIAVPTSYAGSEVTPVWGLTEGDRKTTGVDLAVLPRSVIYDPELTVTLPGTTQRGQRIQRPGALRRGVLGPRAEPDQQSARRGGHRGPGPGPAGRRRRRHRSRRARATYCTAPTWLATALRGRRLRVAPQDLPRARRRLRPAPRRHARGRSAVRAGVQPRSCDGGRRPGRACGRRRRSRPRSAPVGGPARGAARSAAARTAARAGPGSGPADPRGGAGRQSALGARP